MLIMCVCVYVYSLCVCVSVHVCKLDVNGQDHACSESVLSEEDCE